MFRQQFLAFESAGVINYEFPDTVKISYPNVLNEEPKQQPQQHKSSSSNSQKSKSKQRPASRSSTTSQMEYELVETHPPPTKKTSAWYSIQQKQPYTSKIIFDNTYFIYGFNQSTDPYSIVLVYYSGLEHLLPSHNKTL